MADNLAQVQKGVRFWQRLLAFAGYTPAWTMALSDAKPKPRQPNGLRKRNVDTLISEPQRFLPKKARFTF